MSEPFLAEIRIVGFNFAPNGWALCDGQILPIGQNTALFALIGTFYGGNGQTTFALPNLQGSAPLHVGNGAGLTQFFPGDTGGEDNLTLLQSEIAPHTHGVNCNAGMGDQLGPPGNFWATDAGGNNEYAGPANALMAPGAIGVSGGSLPHNNLQPYLVLNFIIALQGIFPARP